MITMDTYGHLFPASNDRAKLEAGRHVQEHKQTFPTPLHHGFVARTSKSGGNMERQ